MINKSIKKLMSLLIVPALLLGAAGGAAFAVSGKYAAYPLPRDTSLAGKTVFIDAGHGVEPRGGATGGFAAGYAEHTNMLNLARMLETNLANLGANVILTRTGAENVTLAERVSIINKYSLGLVRAYKQAQLQQEADEATRERLSGEIATITELEAVVQKIIDEHGDDVDSRREEIFNFCDHPAVYNNVVYISLHSNAASSTSVNGVDVFITTNSASKSSYYRVYSETKANRSRLYANLLLDEINAATGMKKRNVIDDAMFMTSQTNVPGVLLELGFHTNSSDRAKLQSDEYRKYAVNSIALATVEYFRQTSGLYASDTTPAPEQPPTGGTPDTTAGLTPTENFVYRFYVNALSRLPAASEIDIWNKRLIEGRYTGATMAYGFILSVEMEQKQLDDTEFVLTLYRTMLGREAEAAGLDAWRRRLSSGWSRERVFSGFADSAEFAGICFNYGINR